MFANPGVFVNQTRTSFADRHIGPDRAQQDTMLRAIGYSDLPSLMDAAIPAGIRSSQSPKLPSALSESEVLERLRELADRNRPGTAMIGLGYHPTVTPPVIRRNVLEDPGWYTAYTPYQPEISQGRLEALLNFQTMIADLTGLPTANSSLLDESTAAAEAMTLIRRVNRKHAHDPIALDLALHPQTIAVIKTRAANLGIELIEIDARHAIPQQALCGAIIAQPGTDGHVMDLEPAIEATHEQGGLAVVVSDIMSLVLLNSPGSQGADVVVGSSQRFGVPMFYGGPHAGFMAVREGLERNLPGRLVGVSVDRDDRPAYRLALQTREQHIRRERATSNICTAQVLLAVVAGMYGVYHGPDGLREIASRIHQHASDLAHSLRSAGVELVSESFFDTITARVPGSAAQIVADARDRGYHLRHVDDDHVSVSIAETTTDADIRLVSELFGASHITASGWTLRDDQLRSDEIMTHPVFHSHRSETQLLRYLRRLRDRDYALDQGMIPLGSCTMKLNAAAEMEPISWPGFAELHPFVPSADASGMIELIQELESWLAAMTGYAAVSIQPNAGSQGELAGLLAIRSWQRSRGQHERDVCLIPDSAHGTNAASAVLAGMRVVLVGSAASGEVDLDDLRDKCAKHADDLAAIMVTYPSTNGVYEDGIGELCQIVHDHGGQVYLDGANLNALLGFAEPGRFGGDVSHLNLHKTFCIPHGGGGPGVGPVAVADHLVPFLPSHPMHPDTELRDGIGAISAAPYGSAGILPISYAYIAMMAMSGLSEATSVAVLNANYIAHRLGHAYPVLFTGANGLVAHECILDLREITKDTGISVDDVAKRLIDYGFHAPTMSFPVAGTFMVEPTESEDLEELDRFCDAMLAIREEIDRAAGTDDNPLVNAPHTAHDIVNWNHAYDQGTGLFPLGQTQDKYWPPVSRIDQAYGDRNLACACPPPEAFA